MCEKTEDDKILEQLETWIDDNQEAIMFAQNFFGKEHPFSQFLVVQQRRINNIAFHMKNTHHHKE